MHRAVGKVDRRAALAGVFVEGAAGLHVVRDIGDVHAQLVAAALAPHHRHGVVEIPGVVTVDGDRQAVAEVRPALAVLRPHHGSRPAGLGRSARAVGLGDAVPPQDDRRVHARRVGLAQHLGNTADRPPRRRRPPRDLDLHHVARRGVPRLGRRDHDAIPQAAVERHHVHAARRRRSRPAPPAAPPRARSTRTMRPSRRPVAPGRHLAHGDPVAVERLVKLRPGNVEVAGGRIGARA